MTPVSELRTRRLAHLSAARFYAIFDLGYAAPGNAETMVAAMCRGGVDIVQLRAKKSGPRELIALAHSIGRVLRAEGRLFILNDHPGLAAEVEADGVHVGQDDLGVAKARALAGADRLVGKSTHSLEQALAGQAEEADYIGVGPLYPTPTKPDYVPVGLPLIAQVKAAVRVPQFCIGGVNLKTLPEVLKAGAERVVIVSAILQSDDVSAYCRRVRELLDQNLT